jgi:uncharacterized protein YndB with AHSA1/START domain
MQVKIQHGVLINKPVADVFAYVSNPENMIHWQSGMHQVTEKRDLANARLRGGAQVRDKRNILGKDIDSRYEVVEFEQNRILHMRLVDGPISFQMRWTFEESDGGTWFQANGGGDLGDLPASLSERGTQRQAQNLLRHDMETLKDILEG